jgi:hypothetical protein
MFYNIGPWSVSKEEKMPYDIETCCQCYKTFLSVIYDICIQLECLLDLAGKARQGQTL